MKPKDAIFFILAGLLFVAIGVFGEGQYLWIWFNGVEAQGEILENHSVGRGPIVPIFQFEVDGKVWKVQSSLPENAPSGVGPFKKGDKVTVLFNPKNPNSAEIKIDLMNPFTAYIIIGIILICIAILERWHAMNSLRE